MKGILLAGGTGSRIWPLSAAVNKHLLPIFDKPMIYYPLTTLMFAGVSEILIISSPTHVDSINNLLGDGSQWGLKLTYEQQDKPEGIAQAFKFAKTSFHTDSVCLALGDNLLYGMGLGSSLQTVFTGTGALAFAYPVADPSEYGVIVVDRENRPTSIEEKPKSFISNLAIPGLYFFDHTVYKRAENLSPSIRGELEITDLLRVYMSEGKLDVRVLERGTAWLDTGSAENLLAASEFVRVIEERQGLKIGCPEEIAFRIGLISIDKFKSNIETMPKGKYRYYLESLLSEDGFSKI
jgi:glucose-1-phosphate thymidylyltransferase